MKKFVITIGREFGSMGQQIGEILAKDLGVTFYDREILKLSAENVYMSVSELEDYDESMDTMVMNKSIVASIKANVIQDKLYREESEVIKQVAKRESCVIVGRCADYILKDVEEAMHIFIYAPYGERYNNVLNEYGLTHEFTEEMLEEVDRARHNYYKRYTKTDRGDREGKHLIIDSSLLGIEGTAELLKEIAIKKFKLTV